MNNEPPAWMQDYENCKCPDFEARCFSDRVFRMMQKYTQPVKELTDNFIYKNHMGYVSPSGAFYAPDYPTWKEDGFTPVYQEPVAWMNPESLECGHGGNVDWEDTGCIPLYTHPAPKLPEDAVALIRKFQEERDDLQQECARLYRIIELNGAPRNED